MLNGELRMRRLPRSSAGDRAWRIDCLADIEGGCDCRRRCRDDGRKRRNGQGRRRQRGESARIAAERLRAERFGRDRASNTVQYAFQQAKKVLADPQI